MKFLLPTLFLFITFLGCAQKNAFQRFHLTASQELAEDNLQSSKVMNKKGEVVGIVTAVYLDKINPKSYSNHEYFYVYLYAKNKKDAISFYLNGMPSLSAEKLPTENEFTALTSFKAQWNKYYLVSFAKQKGTLNLKIQIGTSSATLTFKQD